MYHPRCIHIKDENFVFFLTKRGRRTPSLSLLILSLVKVQVALPIAECKIFLINTFPYIQNCLMANSQYISFFSFETGSGHIFYLFFLLITKEFFAIEWLIQS
jgi:hypothetical protein